MRHTDEEIHRYATSLRSEADLDPLIERVGDARFVLLGEASHGTSEYYGLRAEITRRLIEEKGFTLIAVEGDWPDCLAIHSCVTGSPASPEDPRAVLDDFVRWPTWMWANEEVLHFLRRLRRRNMEVPMQQRVGFFGMDVYSLWDSLRSVLDYLREHEPEHVEAALAAYRCFEPYAEDPQSYARSVGLVPESCEPEVVSLLAELRRETPALEPTDQPPLDPRFARFAVEQNAEVVAGAERYYRAMLRGGPDSWNVRDHHMVNTLDRLVRHHGGDTKVIVWAHNTHVGDARATDMGSVGMVNVGQLVRERHGDDNVLIVGFGSHSGSVIAADRWGDRPREMSVPPARPDSIEARLHGAVPDGNTLFVFPFPERGHPRWLREEAEHRAIGVVYRPGQERWGNYVPTVLGRRYDAFVYCDRTRALTPLHDYEPAVGEPETYPSAV